MDNISESISLYEEIIEINYSYWIKDENIDVEKEDFRLQVDMKYRMKYKSFPVGDIDMEIRLDEICDEIGEELVTKEREQEISLELTQLKDTFLNNLDRFLSQKAAALEQVYPQSRRFKRKDIKMIQRIDFVSNEIDSADAYDAIFEEMIQDGYFRLIECGGHPKHDIFHVIEV